MPSQHRRLILTLPPDIDAAIDRCAAAFDKPRSAVVVDLLQELTPMLTDLAKVAEHTKANRKSAAKRVLQHMVGDKLAELMADMQPELFDSKKRK
jgi:Zn-dependent oligopeptidase